MLTTKLSADSTAGLIIKLIPSCLRPKDKTRSVKFLKATITLAVFTINEPSVFLNFSLS